MADERAEEERKYAAMSPEEQKEYIERLQQEQEEALKLIEELAKDPAFAAMKL